MRLFAERAHAAVPEFALTEENRDAVAEICARLEGLPLAIELAAPRVRTLTPAALLRRLDQRLALLTGGAQDLDERQRTLRGTIEWSYDLLVANEKTLFERLGVFVRGSRLEAAEAVCNPDGTFDGTLLDGLDSLVEKSLLRQRADSDGEPRFWMLETIREFALEKLESAGEADAVRRRHADWFAELAEALDAESRTGDQAASIARLGDDHSNLRAAINRAREGRDGELLLRLATALWPFWSTRGYVAEGRRALEDALELAGRRPARALLGLCSLRFLSGSSDGLLDDVNEVLRAAEELEDTLTLVQAWNLLGRIEGTLLGSMARAEEAWRQALEYAERESLRAERAESIGWLMMSANFGPLPVEEGIARCKRFHDGSGRRPGHPGERVRRAAALEAMRGDFRSGPRAPRRGQAAARGPRLHVAGRDDRAGGALRRDARRRPGRGHADPARELRRARADGRARVPLHGGGLACAHALRRGRARRGGALQPRQRGSRGARRRLLAGPVAKRPREDPRAPGRAGRGRGARTRGGRACRTAPTCSTRRATRSRTWARSSRSRTGPTRRFRCSSRRRAASSGRATASRSSRCGPGRGSDPPQRAVDSANRRAAPPGAAAGLLDVAHPGQEQRRQRDRRADEAGADERRAHADHGRDRCGEGERDRQQPDRDQPVEAGHAAEHPARDVALLDRRPHDRSRGLESVEDEAREHQLPRRRSRSRRPRSPRSRASTSRT